MNANELRIGNFVYDTKGQVNTIDLEAITYIVKEPLNQVKPIPITEDWLKRFGFNKFESTKYTSYNSINIEGDEGEIKQLEIWLSNGFASTFVLCDKNQDGIIFSQNIKYVHQLQNLYFALTGYELILQK